MALPAQLWPITIAGALNLILGTLLMTLNASHRANRAFAAVMIMRAGSHLTFAFTTLASPEDAAAAWRSFPYLGVWLDVGLLYFLACYPAPRRWLPGGWAGPGLFLAAAAAGTLFVASRPDLFGTTTSPGFAFVTLSASALFAVVALVLLRDALRAPHGRARTSMLLIAAGFAAAGVSDLVGARMSGALQPALAPAWPLVAIGVAWLVALGAAAGVALRHLRETGARAFLAVVVGTALFALVVPFTRGSEISTGNALSAGLVRLVLPLVVAYALLRLRIFDLDARVQRGLGKGLVVSAFVLLFFLVSETVEQVVSERMGYVAGAAAALALVVALRPLERASDGFARRVFPAAADPAALDAAGRVDVYRDLARTAWAEGEPSPGERRVLDAARERLRVSAADARAVEDELRARAA